VHYLLFAALLVVDLPFNSSCCDVNWLGKLITEVREVQKMLARLDPPHDENLNFGNSGLEK
jgi:hypothetical protein